jgi:uncharacterized RDD family membrane protein YckC
VREEGVYFSREDYAGPFRRLAVLAIDGVVLLLFLAAALVAVVFGVADAQDASVALVYALLAWTAAAALYFVVIERTAFGTLGLKLTGCRVVGLQGQRPSLWAMFLRFGWIVLGPINPILDVAFLAGDPDRQTLRDKLAWTYVVRRGALPAGRGPVVHVHLDFCGWTMLVPQVRREVRANVA